MNHKQKNIMKNLLYMLLLIYSGFAFSQPTSYSPRGIGGDGGTYSLSINPANTDEYYAAINMGELFHTTDFGETYNQVHFNQFVAYNNSKVCFTNTVGLLYSISYPDFKPVPVKSTDNGVTWTKLSGNPNNSESTWSIDADYNNPNSVIISTHNNIYFSDNGGASFTTIHSALNTTAGNVVGGVFFDNDSIYIGTNDGVLVSTNGGANWTTASMTGIPDSEKIWSFAAAKVGDTTRFFCITANEVDIYLGRTGNEYENFAKGIYSIDYGSGNWSAKMTGINLSTQYIMFVGMATNDINTVYLAGCDNYVVPIIIKSVNAGINWTNVFKASGNENIITGWCGQDGDAGWGMCGATCSIAVAPNDANRVIFSGSFINKTTNGGILWQQATVDIADQHPAGSPTPVNQSYHGIGFENTSCWQIYWINANTMWACFTDIEGIRSTDAGNSWSFSTLTGDQHHGGETYRIVQHPTNGTLFTARSKIHDMYKNTYITDSELDKPDPNGKIMYSINNGLTWQDLHFFNHPVYWLAIDPNNPNRAYASVIHYNGGAGIGGIYMTNDLQNLSTSTWTLLPDPPRTEKHPACIAVLNDGKMVCSYSGRIAPTYNFTASSGIFIYDPDANTWSDVSDEGMKYWTKDIVVDINDTMQNTWYAGVYSGWPGASMNTGGLYKTTNRGNSWTKISKTADITSCTFNPNNANELYVTTRNEGLWISHNINTSTPTFSAVTSYDFGSPERVFFNPYNTSEMWVASFGNGMKVGTVNSIGISELEENKLFSIYPNPSNESITIKLNDINDKQQLQIYNSIGVLLKECEVSQKSKINIADLSNGLYFICLKNQRQLSLKFIKQ
jgi:photosystem II stability/assembly factor-like uncharacterized protein